MKGIKLDHFEENQLNPEFETLSFSIVLVQPETIGNIGAVARVMKNFNFNRLVIFNPKETNDNIKSCETLGHAMHGKDVLLRANIFRSQDINDHFIDLKHFLEKFDLVIGTTAKGKHYTNVRRLSIFLDHLSLPISNKLYKIALLFGKESNGLTNQEILLVDVIIRIPTSKEYPTLNLSHACSIILYEIFKKIHKIKIGRGKHPVVLAEKHDRHLLYDFIKDLIQKLRLKEYSEKNIYFAFKNILERAIASKKEIRLLTGFFSKFHSILKNINLFE
ncbi:MAG: RNA methyltransferase [Promethearchaeota archaeon]